ncbi:MAG: hypothetical protein UR93_C0015G0007 [Berkelbacteria bacterium GW2011_GWA2_35_9]|uniref:Uncharacterized protein n=1 Tax=Berkelbacteria bacterium GW2011_GWA2_35_9 TaxID=1618333 RepID=A0A0G0G9I2_9BACT|nr:MAG: hypothetical protein UR93_C0015G0007 [Berkelbacteria bacterium GW2011_GWA2_35_9]
MEEGASVENRLFSHEEVGGLDFHEISKVAKQLFPRAENVFSLLRNEENCKIQIEKSTLSRYITDKIYLELASSFPGIDFQINSLSTHLYIKAIQQKRIIRKGFLFRPVEVTHVNKTAVMRINKYTHFICVYDSMFFMSVRDTLKFFTDKYPEVFARFTISCNFQLS